jgi:hypothetical protein
MKQFSRLLWIVASAFFVLAPCKAATPDGKGFPTADAAARALIDAVKTDNVPELIQILGPSGKEIVSTRDPVADRKTRRTFTARAAQKTRLIPYHDRQNEKILLAGNDGWPLPIPIVEVNGKWYFDTSRGKQEILARRVGSNELDAIEVCRGYVEAQNDYGDQHHTPDGVPYFAQKIISSPGERDGLYWPKQREQDDNESPISSIIAHAIAEGYTNKSQPYHGYYFRVLTAQGPHSGPPMSYIDNSGVMTKGFALIAWPADYRSTGIMTFVVDKSGIVYQKDLGQATAKIAAGYTAYDPDPTWKPVSGDGTSVSKNFWMSPKNVAETAIADFAKIYLEFGFLA